MIVHGIHTQGTTMQAYISADSINAMSAFVVTLDQHRFGAICLVLFVLSIGVVLALSRRWRR
jgi:hypothetical protein